ncbi:unnamed protein product [Rhizoctonia solani]|uniref:Uncharacterized protein n=1 Tax=Rhizoctonia solani TaxID=456999 RepID=A0A8H3GTD8_9AGAM|nr:unnamed protein product [Rhizoctonia solani]
MVGWNSSSSVYTGESKFCWKSLTRKPPRIRVCPFGLWKASGFVFSAYLLGSRRVLLYNWLHRFRDITQHGSICGRYDISYYRYGRDSLTSNAIYCGLHVAQVARCGFILDLSSFFNRSMGGAAA